MKEMCWNEVVDRAHRALVGFNNINIYGIPRGGMCVVGGLGGVLFSRRGLQATCYPENADVFIDDVIDSGATRDRYIAEFPDTPFVAIVDKQGADKDIGWVKFPWEKETDSEDVVRRLIQYVGEDAARDGLQDTPRRVLSALKELTTGYKDSPQEILSTVFEEEYDEMVLVRDIPFWSLCEHHMLPFHGTATVGYIPAGKVVGLSKIARLVQCFAKRLQIQERMTNQIAREIEEWLKPQGVGVIVKASHTCMAMRGVKAAAEMITSSMLGAFRDKPEARQEFLDLAR